MNRKRKILEVESLLSSSTSSEEEVEYALQFYKPPQKQAKILNFVSEVVPDYIDEQFREHFKVNRATYKILKTMFKRSRYFPKKRRGKQITNAQTHMLSFLWYVGNKCVIIDFADRFGVTKSTQHLMLSRVLDFFMSIAPNIICFPTTEEEKQKVANLFQEGCLAENYCLFKWNELLVNIQQSWNHKWIAMTAPRGINCHNNCKDYNKEILKTLSNTVK